MLLFSLSSVVLYGTSPVTVNCGDPIGSLQSTAQEQLSLKLKDSQACI